MEKSYIVFTQNHFFIYDRAIDTLVCFSNNAEDMQLDLKDLLKAIKDKDLSAPVVMRIHNNIADTSFTVQGPMSLRASINHYGNWTESPILYMVTPELQQILAG